MHYLYFRFVCIVAVSLFISCKGPKPKIIKSPPYYSFKDVFTNKLDARLLEVSGIAWDSHIDKFYAHNDESGTLFILERETKSVMNAYKFAGRGDYEDVAIFRHIPYVLRSDGTILKILIDSVAGTARAIESPKLDITGSRDFETMYTDTTRNALIIVCKNCNVDDQSTVSAFAYYPDKNEFDTKPVYQIDASDVDELSPHKSDKFQPTAADIHPKMQKLFMISSPSRQLVIMDLNGNVEEVYELGKKLFPQPEGLTFKNNGDLYISNEGVKSKGTILRFEFKPGSFVPKKDTTAVAGDTAR
jgi:hypothetical protein